VSTRLVEHAVARAADLPEGTHRVVEAGGREIGVFNVRGRLYALPNVCPHQNGPLCRGMTSGTLGASEESRWNAEWILDGEVVVCPWHGLEFEIPTGRCIAYPKRSLPTYEAKVVGDEIVLVLPGGDG
jgi:nitrite reductase/ring-hydroxylating ferredoxin subunit